MGIWPANLQAREASHPSMHSEVNRHPPDNFGQIA